MATRRGIKLERSALTRAQSGIYSVFRLHVRVVQAHLVDPNIFVFIRSPPTAAQNTYIDSFETVASPVDMQDWPVGAPNPSLGQQFFRLHELVLDFRSQTELDTAWTEIKTEVCGLMAALELLDELKVVEEFQCGTFVLPDTDISDSLSN